eukprot:917224-Pelagomonas_calceolata.AAC.1
MHLICVLGEGGRGHAHPADQLDWRHSIAFCFWSCLPSRCKLQCRLVPPACIHLACCSSWGTGVARLLHACQHSEEPGKMQLSFPRGAAQAKPAPAQASAFLLIAAQANPAQVRCMLAARKKHSFHSHALQLKQNLPKTVHAIELAFRPCPVSLHACKRSTNGNHYPIPCLPAGKGKHWKHRPCA